MGLRTKINKFIYNLKFKKNFKKPKLLINENILITGASSGIGLSLSKILKVNNKVLGIYNNNKIILKDEDTKKFIKVKCDLSNENDYGELKVKLKEFTPTVILHCAGSFGSNNQNIDNINSKLIAELIYKNNKNVKYLKNNYAIKDRFFELTQKNDFIINMGAGDCHNLWSILSKKNTFRNKINNEKY